MSEYHTHIRGILPDHEILNLCANHKMLDPFIGQKNQEKSPSNGLSSYGYDITLGCKFKTYKEVRSLFHGFEPVKPGELSEADFEDTVIHNVDDAFVLLPGGFCLAESEQTFDMPSNVMGLVKDKSTFARMGVSVFNTVIEPGWKGVLTLEIINNGNRAVALPIYQGIAQVIFHGCEPCTTTYGEGKYQNAKGLEIPK